MRGLADIRLLVLVGAGKDSRSMDDLDLLARRTTAHQLPVRRRYLPLTLLRLLKRSMLSQDDAVLLYNVPIFDLLVIAFALRLFGLRAISVRQQGQNRHLRNLWKLLGTVNVGLGNASGNTREHAILQSIARAVGRRWEQAQQTPLRIDLGCGSQERPGFIGIDARMTLATAIVSDARSVAVADHVADEVYASCLLEHFDNPNEVLLEINRVLAPDGQAVFRLPNLGTYSSHLDLTHRFLADLALWRRILSGYFDEVVVSPVGTKYRDSPSLVKVNWILVNLFKWYELAQGWDFTCSHPKPVPSIEYTAWWEE